MATTLRSGKLIDNCTPSISYDTQVKSASEAFDEQMYEIIDETGQVCFIPNILGLTDPNLVDILAWQFNVDGYDSSRDLEFRKQLVQMSIEWHKTKGTVALVQHVLDLYWPGGAWIEEWFDYYEPFPPNYPNHSPDILALTFRAMDVDPALNRFNVVGHGLVNRDQVRFVAGTGGAKLPSPITAGFFYFVVNATSDTFQISESGGVPVIVLDLNDAGTGNANQIWKRGLSSWHDRYRFRIMVNADVISSADEAAVLKLIDRYKPVSRWPEGVVRPRSSKLDEIYLAGAVQFITTRKSGPPEIRTL